LEAHDRFRAAGYEYIGMDHFALPDDELARARREGGLRRNFMGYTTGAGTDLIAMGVSSISFVAGLFAQNTKKLNRYRDALAEDRLPTERGRALTGDDAIRARVIEDLMCRDRVDKRAVAEAFAFDFDEYFAPEIDALAPMIADELLRDSPEAIELNFLGRLFARNVAMTFDAYLKAQRATAGGRPLFSRTL
jgi:oxygen-independent coproporphyrinogen-3 oxidase